MALTRRTRLWLLALAAAGGVLGLALALWPAPRIDQTLALRAQRYKVRVLRDTWGVPHVSAATDAEAAFGLAYAHAEDDFETIQGALLAARGRLAEVYGRGMAPNDYMVQLLRVWDFVQAGYEKDLSPETRALCEAYADGINVYAARHPDEALGFLYPVSGRDVVAGFVHKLPLFFGLDRTLKAIAEGTLLPKTTSHGAFAPDVNPAPATASAFTSATPLLGSNTFAVAPRRSADGATRLAINSHQPWEGPVAWYEAHVQSQQGWDMVGGVFPGAPVILHGHNRNLGWAHTVNRPDLIDVYRLKLNPANPNQYWFDGAWKDLEVRQARIRVKLLGPLHWTVAREVLHSVHGPVMRGPEGTFAIRFAGYGELRTVEQWYRMNKARNLEEWRAAMRLQAIPMFNCGYADKEGNIYYVYNARLPRRAPGYDWAGVLPGDTSATLWTEYLTYDALPQVLNPPSGFVQNCNSSPFRTTTGAGNPDAAAFPPALGIETRMTNRSLRALELLGADESITREEFDAYKFDVTYSEESSVGQRLRKLMNSASSKDPLAGEALGLIFAWDRRSNPENRQAALCLLTLRPTDDNDAAPVSGRELTNRLIDSAHQLQKTFGRLDPPWQDVLRLRRGSVDLGLGGSPDVLHAVYARPADDGRLVGVAGDSYVLLVEWDRAGRVSSRSIHQYGSATRDRWSPHYADQAALFVKGELKPVWLDPPEIGRHVERNYLPGGS
jgi:acyl-homoserine-lactone acylase